MKAKKITRDRNKEKKNKITETKKQQSNSIQNSSQAVFINEIDSELGINPKQPHTLYEEIMKKLAKSNNKDEKIFISGDWVYLQADKLVAIRKEHFQTILAKSLQWMKYNQDEIAENLSKVPDHVISGIPNQDSRFELFPEINGVINFPILKEDGTVVTNKGYDPDTKLYILEDQDIEITDTLEESVEILQEPFEHFHFKDDYDRANAWAFFFSLLFRYRINGQVPFFGFKAPQWGVGKSLLLKSLYQIVEGKDPVPVRWPKELYTSDQTLEKNGWW